MKQDPGLHHRRSIRLPGYDYSQAGAYFVTICTQNRRCLFGNVVNVEMVLNHAGRVVAESWQWMGEQYEHVELDEWVIMPNHLHGIIVISERRGGSRTRSTQTVGTINWCIQNRIHKTHQRIAQISRRKIMATQLLRTYHSR